MSNNKTKKILFLTAPRPASNEIPLHLGDNRPPIGLGYIAAYLEKNGHRTNIVDLYHFAGNDTISNPGVNQEESFYQLSINLDSEIQSFQPDFIGIYIHTMAFYNACALGKELKGKYPNIILMCGGPHPTVLPKSIPSYFDYVVIGEGEYVTLEIVEGKVKKRIVQGIRVKNLDELPWPNYDFFINKPYNWKLKLFGDDILEPVISLNTTRGCPFPCRFCGVRYISGPEFRGVSPKRLVAELVELKKKYNLVGVYFREDNFTSDIIRLEQFCNLMIETKTNLKWACESRVKNLSAPLIEKMSEAGCIGLYIGVESGSPRMLEYIDKKETVEDFLEKFPILRDHGISTYTTWIYGLPSETQADRELSEKLIARLNPTTFDKFVYIGIPKSYFYEQLDKNKEYEFKEPNGFIYPKGYLHLVQHLYGKDDPRCRYVEKLYQKNKVNYIKTST